ncbi:UPF0033 protein YrkF [Lentibacillus sp. JNUCC-1]|uniref:rhodanese-like domain-containing protein n=1 Tax=Lentibacillus sp. JNUCC-1 TaxID=2654513 RepID=UPI0012E90B4C|nr:rhodanese-like domain-containing protein [Lentibacillus sp. JNUCC-1]MUV36702.1 UPF0033 protein YrkF [Lentibacillus sp. JNUCC-1]
MKEITTKQLAEKQKEDADISIIDVREDEEVANGMIPGARHIPLGEIPHRLSEIDKDKTHYLVCRSGGRSGKASEFMDEHGYDVINVDGGMLEWKEDTVKKDQ